MWSNPLRTSKKREREEEEPDNFNKTQAKKVRFEEQPNIQLTEEELLFKRNYPGPEGLYNPDKDFWVQFHTDGIEDRTKRLLFLQELDIETLRYRRNEAYHKLRALEEGFSPVLKH